MKIEIIVLLKASVLDVEGRTISKTLQENGFDFVNDAKKAKIFYLEVADTASDLQIKEMCEKVLVNTVIETFSYRKI